MIASRRLLLTGAPLAVAAIAGVSFFAMLSRMKTGAFDPHDIGSPMDGKPVPDFSLPGTAGGRGFSSADVRDFGRPLLINFFASWCVPCAVEAGALATLAEQFTLWGIAYKDVPADTARFLGEYGNPFTRLAADQQGATAINFGLYGVPETFLIDRTGIIRARYAGAVTASDVARAVKRLR